MSPMLSTRLVSELGSAHSRLRANRPTRGSSVIIDAGGEVDASNEHTWRRLVGEAAAVATPPGSCVIDVNDLDFMGCCSFALLADEAAGCRSRAVKLRLVSREPMVARIVEACGLSGVLSVHPTRDSALSSS